MHLFRSFFATGRIARTQALGLILCQVLCLAPFASAEGLTAPAQATPPATLGGANAPAPNRQATPAEPTAPAPTETSTPIAPPIVVERHIALILPTNSPTLGPLAKIIQQGFSTAAGVDDGMGGLPYKFYPINNAESDFATAYENAVAAGAVLVVGPLTRPGIKIAEQLEKRPAPILVLNHPDNELPQGMLSFSLSVEDEARQVSALAWQAGAHQIGIVAENSPLAARVKAAFSDDWVNHGGKICTAITVDRDKPNYPALQATASKNHCDAYFIAADPYRSRLILPYIPKDVPLYATSQSFFGKLQSIGYYDLDGLTFVDMPWLLQPDHPAVMIYPRGAGLQTPEEERLFAFGIDSWRLAKQLATKGTLDTLDGVTGTLKYASGGLISRHLLVARYVGDSVELVGSTGANDTDHGLAPTPTP